jgi:hypothetical protein
LIGLGPKYTLLGATREVLIWHAPIWCHVSPSVRLEKHDGLLWDILMFQEERQVIISLCLELAMCYVGVGNHKVGDIWLNLYLLVSCISNLCSRGYVKTLAAAIPPKCVAL